MVSKAMFNQILTLTHFFYFMNVCLYVSVFSCKYSYALQCIVLLLIVWCQNVIRKSQPDLRRIKTCLSNYIRNRKFLSLVGV